MNKYRMLFDFLKAKIGPDPARIIIYDVYCDDIKKYNDYEPVALKLAKIYKKWGIRKYGTECTSAFIWTEFNSKRFNFGNKIEIPINAEKSTAQLTFERLEYLHIRKRNRYANY